MILDPHSDQSMSNGTKNLALYCDFENIALGVRDTNYARFEIQEVLERNGIDCRPPADVDGKCARNSALDEASAKRR